MLLAWLIALFFEVNGGRAGNLTADASFVDNLKKVYWKLPSVRWKFNNLFLTISGAGKTFETWPEMVDNLIPYIGGEEEKSEKEPLKVWGTVENGQIVPAQTPSITAQCLRVPVSDGHTAAVFVTFKNKPTEEEIKAAWKNFQGRAQELNLPSAPKQFLQYFEEPDRPQAKLDRDLEGGMAVTLGRLRPDTQYDYKFVGLSHNTLRGAAGGGVLLAELLCAEGYILPR